MPGALPATKWANHHLEWGQQTYVMGVINVTPDSFSGDGLIEETLTPGEVVARAVAQAQQFVTEGAMMIDVGGESTRPGFAPITAEMELDRVLPVIKALYAVLPEEVMISIDTYKAEVARQALDAGACIVNDIWALRRDPDMAALVSERAIPLILMSNMRGYQRREIVSDVVRFLAQSIDLALAAGVAWEHILIDPGIGFGTTAEENLTLLHRPGAWWPACLRAIRGNGCYRSPGDSAGSRYCASTRCAGNDARRQDERCGCARHLSYFIGRKCETDCF